MTQVRFRRADIKSISLINKKVLKVFLAKIFLKEKVDFQYVDCIFCSNQYILKINSEFLNHKYFTDVITFNLSEQEQKFGEIYISIDTVKINAGTYKSTFQLELTRVLMHGILHLCGYDDKNQKEKFQMTTKENYYLDLYSKVSRETLVK